MKRDKTKSVFFRACAIAIFCGLSFYAAIVLAGDITGRGIMERVRDADSSQDRSITATMLIERGNQKLMRKLSITGKKYGEDERSLTRFFEPADVRDTQFLSWTYEDTSKDDDLWVFFPSENLVRRISGGGKKGSFMRSDFANEDIEPRAVDDDTHKFIERTTLNGRDAYLVESVPIPEKAKDSSYAKRKIWVDQETMVVLQVEFFDKRDRLLKRLTQGELKQIDGIWVATKLIMETPRKNSRTLMQYSQIRYNTGLADNVFEQSSLKR